MIGLTHRRPAPGSTKPSMTSLVDVLTILVVFLIQNYSSEGEIITMSKGLELPSSKSTLAPDRNIVIGITKQHILADGEPIAVVGEEAERSAFDIPNLAIWLEGKKINTEEIAKYDDNVEFMGTVTIQGDKKIPYWLLQKVIMTCGDNGYSNISLAVQKIE